MVKPFDEIKDSLDANLGRMPCIVAQANSDKPVTIGQSAAIEHYIAASLGLVGASVLEAAQIVSLRESLGELKAAFRKLIPYGTPPTEKLLDEVPSPHPHPLLLSLPHAHTHTHTHTHTRTHAHTHVRTQFFSGGATDSKGPAGKDRNRNLPWFLGRLETQVFS